MKDRNWWFDAAAVGLSTAFVAGSLAVGHLGLFSGVTMLGMMGAYIAGQRLLAKNKPEVPVNAPVDPEKAKAILEGLPKPSLLKEILWGSAAIAGLIGSASLLVGGGSALALSLGVSSTLVAMFGFAIGTSLPELMVSVSAAMRGNSGMALGNILGSNIFNNLFVIGFNNAAAATFGDGIKVPADFGWGTLMGKLNNIAYGLSAALPVGFMTYNKLRNGTDGEITRKQGVVMASLYAVFAGVSCALGGVGAEQVAAAAAPPPLPPVPS
jgi:cation:H+ antiporter